MSAENSLLSDEIQYLADHKEELESKHMNQFVLIHERELHGCFDTEQAAILAGYRLFQRGPFLVRKVGQETPVMDNPALSIGVLGANLSQALRVRS